MTDTTISPATPATKKPTVRRPAPVYDDIDAASGKLGLDPNALRARCRRHSRKMADGSIVAHLGGGIVAFKLGKSWRVQFPSA